MTLFNHSDYFGGTRALFPLYMSLSRVRNRITEMVTSFFRKTYMMLGDGLKGDRLVKEFRSFSVNYSDRRKERLTLRRVTPRHDCSLVGEECTRYL